jgi:hypothetical protein
LLLDLADRFEFSEPRPRRTAPKLKPRYDLIALTESANTDTIDLRAIADGGGVDVGATVGTKRLHPAAAALGDLDVDFRFTGVKLEAVLDGREDRAERRARQLLAVGAVTDPGVHRLGLGLEGDLAAVASAVELHWLMSLHGASKSA